MWRVSSVTYAEIIDGGMRLNWIDMYLTYLVALKDADHGAVLADALELAGDELVLIEHLNLASSMVSSHQNVIYPPCVAPPMHLQDNDMTLGSKTERMGVADCYRSIAWTADLRSDVIT